jgi:hypothetical protein
LVNNLNIEINGHITSEEILHCVKNLKNEKACGDDIIKNEYIKSSIDVFLPRHYMHIWHLRIRASSLQFRASKINWHLPEWTSWSKS